ncbi:MAG: hypothetical protein IT285_14145 [Bdellovibrionales bacterium]|nr:hypothetical protein [Bdellovibrionales bacterium]
MKRVWSAMVAALSLVLSLAQAGCIGDPRPMNELLEENAAAVEAQAAVLGAMIDALPDSEHGTPEVLDAALAQGQAKGIAAIARKAALQIENPGDSANGVSFSHMNVEEALLTMLLLIADDAREDLKQLLSELDALNQQKRRMREAIGSLQDLMQDLKELAREEYERLAPLSPADTSEVTETHTQVLLAAPGPSYSIPVIQNAPGLLRVGVACRKSGAGLVTLTLASLSLDSPPDSTLQLTPNSPSGEILLPQAAAGPYRLSLRAYVNEGASRVIVPCDLTVTRRQIVTTATPGLTQIQLRDHAVLVAQLQDEAGAALQTLGALTETEEDPLPAFAYDVGLNGILIGLNRFAAPSLSLEMYEAQVEAWNTQLDAASSQTEELNLKLQKYSDRQSQAFQMLSGIMKSFHDTAKSIIQNIK